LHGPSYLVAMYRKIKCFWPEEFSNYFNENHGIKNMDAKRQRYFDN